MKTLTLLATYTLALTSVLFWWLLVQVAIRCDSNIKADWNNGEQFDRFDPALERLEAVHATLFGSEE
jgi:hypothetical protein